MAGMIATAFYQGLFSRPDTMFITWMASMLLCIYAVSQTKNADTKDDSHTLLGMNKKQYILQEGVLFWGVSTGIIFSIIQYVRLDDFDVFAVILALIIFPIGGISFGHGMWKFLMKRKVQYSE